MSAKRPSKTPQIVTDPESLHALKDELLATWMQVPTKHQSGMVLELLNSVMNTGQRLQTREDIEARWPMAIEAPGEFFLVTRISRKDLEHLQFSEDEIAQLDDDNMGKIAQKMEDYYVNGEFWDDLKFATRKILREKQEREKGSP